MVELCMVAYSGALLARLVTLEISQEYAAFFHPAIHNF